MNEQPAARVLRDPALGPVVAELARRMGASDRPVATVTVVLDEPGRVAVAEVLGLPRLPPVRYRLRTDRLAGALGIEERHLRDVVADVAGPVGNRARERAAAQAERDEAVATVTAAAEPSGPAVVAWAQRSVVRLPGPVEERVRDVTVAVAAIGEERDAPVPLPVLAARLAGDPHAFDAGSRAGDLLVGCAAAAAEVPAPVSTVGRRGLLARFGIVADELSSTVSAWRLPFPAGHPLAGAAGALVDAGEPVVLSLAMVQRWPVHAPEVRVLVVENPSVLATAAAERFPGPMVCSSGQPSAAVLQLVSQLAGSGARVDVHADFDPGGFSVVQSLMAVGGQPWRMGAGDYLEVLARSSTGWDGRRMTGTPWDPQLAVQFGVHRRVVYEEQLLDVIADRPATAG